MPLSPEDKRVADSLGMTYAEAARIKEQADRLFEDGPPTHRDVRSDLSHRVAEIEPDHSILSTPRRDLRYGD